MTDVTARFTNNIAPSGHPNVAPRDAATLILLDRSGPEPKVLMGRRHQGHVFLPGKFVFPGGRVDPADRKMAIAGPLDPRAEAKLLAHVKRPNPGKARALVLTAIRETFEETGLLLGIRRDAPPRTPEGPWATFAAHNIYPDLSKVHFIARAITPPGRSRRYDTRFLTCDASSIAHKIEGVIGPESELVELLWVSLAEARKLDMIAITDVVLESLQKQIEAGFSHDLPVPFYRQLHGKRVREML
jgi:8-oxo-dGTP pyrophosphatase MutT (NUDIX family)